LIGGLGDAEGGPLRAVSALISLHYEINVTLSMTLVNTEFDKIAELYHTGHMSGPEAIQIIKMLGISQRRFALLVGLHPNAVTKWAKGTEPQGPARALLRLLKERPELVAVLERTGE
jgi:DNA-binding transcriptional regulator YiaG